MPTKIAYTVLSVAEEDGASPPPEDDMIVGEIRTFAFSPPPAGWLVCDGSAVSRATYADLFAAIGETWGPGDSLTTFNVPALAGRFLRGVGAGLGLGLVSLADTGGEEYHTLLEEELPEHDHSFTTPDHQHSVASTDTAAPAGGNGRLWSTNDIVSGLLTGTTGLNAPAIGLTDPNLTPNNGHNTLPPYRGVVLAIYAGV